MLQARRFCFRNAARTNLLVGLMRLELNGQANERHYAEIIRDHLQARGAQPGRQLAITDTRGTYSLRPRGCRTQGRLASLRRRDGSLR